MPIVVGMPVSEEVYNLNKDSLGSNKVASKPASKYHNTRTEANGLRFASGKEAAGCKNLMLLEQQHEIFGLRLQVHFPLQAKIAYIADALYVDKLLQVHVVDFKGFRTPEYKLKKKLFREKYGHEIEEV